MQSNKGGWVIFQQGISLPLEKCCIETETLGPIFCSQKNTHKMRSNADWEWHICPLPPLLLHVLAANPLEVRVQTTTMISDMHQAKVYCCCSLRCTLWMAFCFVWVSVLLLFQSWAVYSSDLVIARLALGSACLVLWATLLLRSVTSHSLLGGGLFCIPLFQVAGILLLYAFSLRYHPGPRQTPCLPSRSIL